MLVDGRQQKTIWFDDVDKAVYIIDQRFLPHKFQIEKIDSFSSMCNAISEMHLRGAIVIGVAAGYGVYLAVRELIKEGVSGGAFIEQLSKRIDELKATRPTAVNLAWGADRLFSKIYVSLSKKNPLDVALEEAKKIESEELENCYKIGEHGFDIIKKISEKKGKVNVLTHCNAGWLACVDWGTALSPVYYAHRKGIDLHVWVDETRPRNQGARLTAWELLNEGIDHTVIADNTGGLLMRNGEVDVVIVGADRVAKNGDTANKIGTYLKALAAKDNDIPFYVALPVSSFDISIADGNAIPIEKRGPEEVCSIYGLSDDGEIQRVRLVPHGSACINYGFDITPSRFISGFITEYGVISPLQEDIVKVCKKKDI